MAKGVVKWFNDSKGFGFMNMKTAMMSLSTFQPFRATDSNPWLKEKK